MEKEKYGKELYNFYKIEVGGKTFSGEKMTEFDEMPEYLKNAWNSSALKFLTSYEKHI